MESTPVEMLRTEPVSGPAVWSGASLAGDSSWIHRLSPAAIAEIDRALDRARALGLPWHRIGREHFPLPALDAELKAVAAELDDGRGFVQMKGLPVERYTLEEARMAYWGIASRLGQAISQNAAGDLIGDVRDHGVTMASGNVRGYQTRSASPFHTDECDLVGLLCWRPAKRGGRSLVVSAMTLYNEMLRRYPWYVALLYREYAFDWRGEQPPGRPQVYRWPLYTWCEGDLSCRYSRRAIELAQRLTGVPLSEVELALFERLDALIEELQLELDFEPGDMQLLNNHMILHSRTSFEDHPEPERKRHLLRVWLSSSRRRHLPARMLAERDPRIGVPARGRPAP